MRCRILAVLFAGGGLLITASAQDSATHAPPGSPDTTKIYPLDEVVTTATRLNSVVRTLPSPILSISRVQIDAKPGSLLSNALSATPALFVRAYGGGNALQTVSIRGMAPEQTLVLIDGQRVNSFQNGQTDFGFLTSANVERVEVVKGGYSALYGADAVGGVVSITTKRSPEKMSGALQQSFGSYGFQATELSLGSTTGPVGWQADVRKERGSGAYQFIFSDGSTETDLTRNGNDFQTLNAQARVDWAAEEEGRVFLTLSHMDADRGVAAPVTDPSSSGKARLSDKTTRGILGTEWGLGSSLAVKLTGMATYSEEDYADPGLLLNGIPLSSSGINRQFQITPEVRYTGSPALTGILGADLGNASYRGTDLTDADRRYVGVFASTQHNLSLGSGIPFDLNIFPSLRYDAFSDVEGDLSPRIGVNLGLVQVPEIRVRSSYGKSFRAPTFNDLYWIAGGNPDLKPERSLSFDAGLLASVDWNGIWTLDGSYFNINTKDRIVWAPTSGTYWSPKNISEVRSKGFELEGTWSGLDGLLTLAANGTWTDARKTSQDFPGDPTEDKQLIYVPAQTFNVSATLQSGGWKFYVENLWVSYRYTTETNDQFLPSYSVTSAALGYRFPLGSFRLLVKGEATNIFNTQYQVLALYPMPTREFRLTAGVEL
jgi:vitamin B12 transporter